MHIPIEKDAEGRVEVWDSSMGKCRWHVWLAFALLLIGSAILALIFTSEEAHASTGQQPTSLQRYDSNCNGATEKAEARTAISDYFSGQLEKAEVREVIRLYFLSPSIPPPTVRLPDSNNARWLEHRHPDVYRQMQYLPWVCGGITSNEEYVIEQLLYLGAVDIANLTSLLALPWIQDYQVTTTLKDMVFRLRLLNYYDKEAIASLIGMPFLQTLETSDMLAVWAMSVFVESEDLSVILEHPTAADGLTDEETILVVAAVSAQRSGHGEDVSVFLNPGYASVESASISTELTPTLTVSIVRTETPVSHAAGLVGEAAGFVEELLQRSLPHDHLVLVLSEKTVTRSYAGDNFGFAMSYKPHYEQAMDTARRQLFRLGIVHEVAHYYWRHASSWVNEGMASTMEYMYAMARTDVAAAWARSRRRDCEAHDLQMLTREAPSTGDRQFICNYYLGQRLFMELQEAFGDDTEFARKLDELYLLTLAATDDESSIDLVKTVFGEQVDIVDKHWSGGLNAPEHRSQEGIDRITHDLIQWEALPTYDPSITSCPSNGSMVRCGGAVRFHGTLLAGAELSKPTLSEAQQGGYPNFTLIHADEFEDTLGGILPEPRPGYEWLLDDPGDSVSSVYQLTNGEFRIEFPFPEALQGEASDYVVVVWGFLDSSRSPLIGENLDPLGYARIRNAHFAP